MANNVKLTALTRTESGRNAVKRVRSRGAVPAVIYGSRQTSANLEVNRRDLEVLLSRAVGENILVDLEIKDGASSKNQLSLIQEVQHHAVRREILHVDFQAVSMSEEITAEIALEHTGEADGVKNHGGLLEQNIRSMEIRCLPKNLPELIKIDVSHLKVGEAIHIRDIALPEGVTSTADPDLTVIIIAEPKVSAAETKPAAAGKEAKK
jgi:large subunit ribosomal protein L25